MRKIARYARVPLWLNEACRNATAIRVFAQLAGKYMNRKNGLCFPARGTLARDLGVNKSTIDRALKDLVRLRAITIVHQSSDAGDPTSNQYVLHFDEPQGVAANLQPPSRRNAATVVAQTHRGGRENGEGGSGTGDAQTIEEINHPPSNEIESQRAAGASPAAEAEVAPAARRSKIASREGMLVEERGNSRDVDAAFKAWNDCVGKPPVPSIKAKIIATLATGTPLTHFVYACEQAAIYQAQSSWRYIEDCFKHYNAHGIGCECARPFSASKYKRTW